MKKHVTLWLVLVLLMKKADNRNENSAITISSIYCDFVETSANISFCGWKLLKSLVKSVSHQCQVVAEMKIFS